MPFEDENFDWQILPKSFYKVIWDTPNTYEDAVSDCNSKISDFYVKEHTSGLASIAYQGRDSGWDSIESNLYKAEPRFKKH